MSVISIEASGTSVRFGNADGTFFFIESINIISNQAKGDRIYIDYEGSGSVVIDYNEVVSPVTANPEDLSQSIQQVIDDTKECGDSGAQTVVLVTQASDLAGALDSNKLYQIDTPLLNMGSQSIEVPIGGLQIAGFGFGITTIFSAEPNYQLFTSPVGGSGSLTINGINISTPNPSSQVYDLTDATGGGVIDIQSVNYVNCASLGEISEYRQILETTTARVGGTPELTLSGNMGGVRISPSLVMGISDMTALFKSGTGLLFASRFITDINCDLPTNGALLDFSSANFVNDETLILQGTSITRNGLIDPMDTTIYPNIDQTSIKCKWKDNTGLPNTKKYIKGNCTAEVTTTINLVSQFEVLQGTIAVQQESQFAMPSNGEFQLLSGAGMFEPTGTIILESRRNDTVILRVTKSTDGGATYPEVVETVTRTINNLMGTRDVAFYNLDFLVNLEKGDRLRLEVANASTTQNITQELDSSFIITDA